MTRNRIKHEKLRELYLKSKKDGEQALAIPFGDETSFRAAQEAIYGLDAYLTWSGEDTPMAGAKQVLSLKEAFSVDDEEVGDEDFIDDVDQALMTMKKGDPIYVVMKYDRRVIFWRATLKGVGKVIDRKDYKICDAGVTIWRPRRND